MIPTVDSSAAQPRLQSADYGPALARLEQRLPALLSVIAGMVDLIGFLNLGNVFTAHITGNLVVIGALVVRRGRVNLAQILAIPVFVLAVAAVWLIDKWKAYGQSKSANAPFAVALDATT